MALQDYYELSAMLRIQLPILLSFSFLRCLIGKVTTFWAKRLVSDRVQTLCQPVVVATANTLSFLHGIILAAIVFYTLSFYREWSEKRYPNDTTSYLLCTEFANTRVQGLVCATGLLALFTSSDTLTLGMALCTFKAVSDGASFGPVMAALTWRASASMHDTYPALYFPLLFACTLLYGSYCHTGDKNDDRTQGATLAACFGALVLLSRASVAGGRRILRGGKRSGTLIWTLVRTVWLRAMGLVRRRATGHTD